MAKSYDVKGVWVSKIVGGVCFEYLFTNCSSSKDFLHYFFLGIFKYYFGVVFISVS
ncbi:MAG: hypothetical protein ACK4F9_01055 [Brevinematia bacterium]